MKAISSFFERRKLSAVAWNSWPQAWKLGSTGPAPAGRRTTWPVRGRGFHLIPSRVRTMHSQNRHRIQDRDEQHLPELYIPPSGSTLKPGRKEGMFWHLHRTGRCCSSLSEPVPVLFGMARPSARVVLSTLENSRFLLEFQ